MGKKHTVMSDFHFSDPTSPGHLMALRIRELEAENEKLREGIDMAHLHLLASICECGEPLKETDAFDCLDALRAAADARSSE